MTEALLKQVAEDMIFLKEKLVAIEEDLKEIDSDMHHIKPSYLKKLEKIKKGKFHKYDSLVALRKDIEG